MNATPLDITLNHASLQSFGMPDDRLARVAARRAFVELKQVFMQAAADIEGPIGDMLQRKIRSATEAAELWHMRIAVWDALHAEHDNTPRHRLALRSQLDNMFPEYRPNTSFMPL